jgi:hypothetical protein
MLARKPIAKLTLITSTYDRPKVGRNKRQRFSWYYSPYLCWNTTSLERYYIIIINIIIITFIIISSGARGSWFKHYAASRKVTGWVSDVATGYFNLPNPSRRTMTLGYTQPPTEMSTRNLPVGKSGRRERLTISQVSVRQCSRLVVFNRG